MASVEHQAAAFARSVAPALSGGSTMESRLSAIMGGLKDLGVPSKTRKEVTKLALGALHKDGSIKGGVGSGAAAITLKPKPSQPSLVIHPLVMHIANAACLTGAGVIAALTAADMNTKLFKDKRKDALQNAMLNNGILAVVALLWFPIFDITIGTHRVFAEPKVIIGYIWPILMSILDMVHISRRKTPDAAETKERDKYLTSQVAAVVAAAFSLALLLSNTRSPSVTKLILVALAIALLSVLPSPQLKEGSLAKSGVQTAQKGILMYTISIVAVGLIMDLSAGSLRNEPSLPGGTGLAGGSRRLPSFLSSGDSLERLSIASIGRS